MPVVFAMCNIELATCIVEKCLAIRMYIYMHGDFPLQSMNVLKESLSNDSVTVTEVRFRTNEGIDGINTDFLVSSQMLKLHNVKQCSIQEIRLCIFYLGCRDENLCASDV